MKALHEKHESLWVLIISPLAWAAHFLLSYITAAIWCAKFAPRFGTLGPARVAIAVYSVVALGVIVWNGWGAWKRHRHEGEPLPHDADTSADRYRFLGFATLLLASLSGVAVVFAALVIVFVEDCR